MKQPSHLAIMTSTQAIVNKYPTQGFSKPDHKQQHNKALLDPTSKKEEPIHRKKRTRIVK